jgi:hypothetical protein
MTYIYVIIQFSEPRFRLSGLLIGILSTSFCSRANRHFRSRFQVHFGLKLGFFENLDPKFIHKLICETEKARYIPRASGGVPVQLVVTEVCISVKANILYYMRANFGGLIYDGFGFC